MCCAAVDTRQKKSDGGQSCRTGEGVFLFRPNVNLKNWISSNWSLDDVAAEGIECIADPPLRNANGRQNDHDPLGEPGWPQRFGREAPRLASGNEKSPQNERLEARDILGALTPARQVGAGKQSGIS